MPMHAYVGQCILLGIHNSVSYGSGVATPKQGHGIKVITQPKHTI